MTKDEALKLALKALETLLDSFQRCEAGYPQHIEMRFAVRDTARIAIDRAKEALAQPEQEPVGKLQEATAERAWFTIAELNAWADKKLSENPHWVMPKDEPERDEPPPQREWVGLTDEEIPDIYVEGTAFFHGVKWAEARLKEKNT